MEIGDDFDDKKLDLKIWIFNCSEDLEDRSRVDNLNNLSVKMSTSGYKTVYIRKVKVAGIKTYEKKLRNS